MKRALPVGCLLLLLAGCGGGGGGRDVAPDSGSPASITAGGAGPVAGNAVAGAGMAAGAGPQQGNGQTGSMTPSQCIDDSDCRRAAVAQLEAYAAPSTARTEFPTARCEGLAYGGDARNPPVRGTGCICERGGGSRWVGPRGHPCFLRARTGDCLWPGDDFAGCELGQHETCRVHCDELAARIDQDEARALSGEVRFAACTEHGICRSVVELEGRCYVDQAYMYGRSSSDCALSKEQILAQSHEDQQANQGELLPSPSPYLEGTHGFVELSAGQTFWAGAGGSPWFGGFAQFFSVSGKDGRFGEVIDPLEGVDDCGVLKRGSPGLAANIDFEPIGELSLIDGATERPFALSIASNDDFYSYILELDPAQVAPRFGANYGLRGGGGEFGERFTLDDFRLPDAIAVPELERSARLPRAALALTWSGRGEAPLRIQLGVVEGLRDTFDSYDIECLVEDDGAFEIPAAVLQAAPEGFVTADFTREQRALVNAGDKRVTAIGRVSISHHFALGEACDRADVMAACMRYAEHVTAAYEECATAPPPPLSELCPAYLAEACTGCPEVFECRTKNTFCTPQGLQVAAFCGCE